MNHKVPPQDTEIAEWADSITQNPASASTPAPGWILDADRVEAKEGVFEDDPIAIRDAMGALTVKDYHSLGVWGKLYAAGTTWAADDLMQEAMLRTMDGRRRWAKSVPIVLHLGLAMKSIAYGQRLKDAREIPFPEPTTEETTTPFEPAAESDFERQVMEKESLEKIRAAFADHPEVLTFLDLMMTKEKVAEVKKVLGLRTFRNLVSLTRRELIRQFPDLQIQMRSNAQNVRKSRPGTRAFECAACSGKVVRTPVGGGHLRWMCEGCNAPYGPPWAEAEGKFETRLVGLQVWSDEPKPPDPVENVHVEFREMRNGETWLVWGDKCRGAWAFWERPINDVRKTKPPQWIIPRLIEYADGVLRRAAGFGDADEPPLAEYVKCIIENNLSRLSDQICFAWKPS